MRPDTQRCLLCGEGFEPWDQQIPTVAVGRNVITGGLDSVTAHMHVECMIREVAGGIGHHEDHDFWCLTMGDPDAGLSYRESAKRVVDRMREGTDLWGHPIDWDPE